MTLLLTLFNAVVAIIGFVSMKVIAIIGIGMLALVVTAFLAPFGALLWWSGWSGQKKTDSAEADQSAAAAAPIAVIHSDAEHYLVYLSGIGDVSGDTLSGSEEAFLAGIAAHMPQVRIIHNVFPYSVTNQGLTDEELLGRFWHWIYTARSSQTRIAMLGGFINLRNMLQVSVSADTRYGPIYNYGTAGVIVQSLLQHGYRLGSGTPVTLFGYSGGGQIVLGAARYLKATIQAPIQLISLGGVMNADPSIEIVDRLYHLYGTRDTVQRIGGIAFPKRWPVFASSSWNRALAEQRVQFINMGPIAHNGPGGYIDADSYLDDGRSFLDHTIETTCQLVHDMMSQPAFLPLQGGGAKDLLTLHQADVTG